MEPRSRIKGRVSPEVSAARVSTWEVTDRPAGVDVNRSLGTPAVDVAVCGLRTLALSWFVESIERKLSPPERGRQQAGRAEGRLLRRPAAMSPRRRRRRLIG